MFWGGMDCKPVQPAVRVMIAVAWKKGGGPCIGWVLWLWLLCARFRLWGGGRTCRFGKMMVGRGVGKDCCPAQIQEQGLNLNRS